MTTVPFDTLKFVERLRAAGVPELQAKAMAEAQIEALGEATPSPSPQRPIFMTSRASYD